MNIFIEEFQRKNTKLEKCINGLVQVSENCKGYKDYKDKAIADSSSNDAKILKEKLKAKEVEIDCKDSLKVTLRLNECLKNLEQKCVRFN
jgi:hypothetical protein